MDLRKRQARTVRNRTEKLTDITTELEHTQEMLHVSEDKYRQLIENADCIILRMCKDGKITFFNEFAQKFFGYTERQILGKNIIGTIIPYNTPQKLGA
jgi:PAS domain-containing protein